MNSVMVFCISIAVVMYMKKMSVESEAECPCRLVASIPAVHELVVGARLLLSSW